MTTKIPHTKIRDFIHNKKILIGILVVGIILIGGFWIWNNQKKLSCLTMDSLYCENNSDCICEGAGCFLGNKNYYEKCVDKTTICLDLCGGWGQPPVKCINNKCSNTYQVEQVIITTDKTEYKQGETVKITVSNGLTRSIWDFGVCGGKPFWGLQKFDEGEWRELNFSFPHIEKGKEICDFIVCERPDLTELKPNSEISDNWNLKTICKWPLSPIGVPKTEPKIIEEGTYRIFLIYGFNKDFSFSEGEIIYSNEFTIK